ncbi:hypothetical protein [Paramuribaculum intestinale]|uniref:hypothetical protein n=1 Tax=Paramuribaculum intestinale TaxID=2094151 RepID=UPI0025B221F2|nr:hypothetical protein [Paramuribaculum intestinale]
MEIITKFAHGDTVWFVNDSRATSAQIVGIHIYPERTAYTVSRDAQTPANTSVVEDKCFATKQELIDYISSEE